MDIGICKIRRIKKTKILKYIITSTDAVIPAATVCDPDVKPERHPPLTYILPASKQYRNI